MHSPIRHLPSARHVLAGAGLALLWAATAQAQQLLPEQSKVTFVSTQMGVPVSGEFTQFDGDVQFDPAKPEEARIELAIDTGSATLGIADTDAELPKPIWFNVAEFPQATFVSTGVQAKGDDSYDVQGDLQIKGRTEAVTVPVTLQRDGDRGTASGEFVIQRLAYGVGEGEWADTSLVADDVRIKFELALADL